jgi:hypothetical protein
MSLLSVDIVVAEDLHVEEDFWSQAQPARATSANAATQEPSFLVTMVNAEVRLDVFVVLINGKVRRECVRYYGVFTP